MLPQVEVPGADRPLQVAGTPVRMTASQGGVWRRAPLVGEDTDSVLADFGFDAAAREALRAGGVVA